MRLLIDHVSHHFADGTLALDQVSLTFGCGMHALLGPNGAGKSTMMNVVAGLLQPVDGHVSLQRNAESPCLDPVRQPRVYRSAMGYLPQRFGFPADATVTWVLQHLGRIRGLAPATALDERIEQVLQLLNLADKRRTRVSRLSGGMRQRLGIAQAILHQPPVLILDEPTVGLDPEEREHLLIELVRYAENAVVILSTHLIEDVESACRHLLFMRKGHMVMNGDREVLVQHLAGKILIAGVDNTVPDGLEHLYRTLHMGRVVDRYIDRRQQPLDNVLTSVRPTVRDIYALSQQSQAA
ncbi:MAG: ATP-binding cassette domain-containing protein [Rhodanobacteraceae bacterium]